MPSSSSADRSAAIPAVALPDLLKQLLHCEHGFYGAEASDLLKQWEDIRLQLAWYLPQVLAAAEALPATPRRTHKPSEAWVSGAWAAWWPVAASWTELRRVCAAVARVLAAKHPAHARTFLEGGGWGMLSRRSAFLAYPEGVTSTPGYRRFVALRSWLHRHTVAGAAKAKAYEALAQTKERRRRNRPAKQLEAERKRVARARAKHVTSGMNVENINGSDSTTSLQGSAGAFGGMREDDHPGGLEVGEAKPLDGEGHLLRTGAESGRGDPDRGLPRTAIH